MRIIIPHVGKSHLTIQLLDSIPDHHKIILIDGSFVADLDTYASRRPATIEYVRTPEPFCLAKNWNLGASHVPLEESEWMFCASDIAWHAAAWRRLNDALAASPETAIVKDSATNWNVWVVRRWAWDDILAPMDERYKPCGGEDDDIVMRCHEAGLKIRNAWIAPLHLEGGHATRLDIRRQESGVGSWDGRRENIARFREKWGCEPTRRDARYQEALKAVLV